MRIGSLFSGIGGLELGLEWAGVGRTVWQCERNADARRVLERHWPGVRCYDDVTTMGVGEPIPGVEVICGGFPCQDISLAGLGAGIRGERSGLFFEAARVIRLVRPRFIVLENVPAITARGLGEVLGELAGIGYDAEWHRVSAANVGAHHLRERWFLIGWRQVADADGAGRAQRDASAVTGGMGHSARCDSAAAVRHASHEGKPGLSEHGREGPGMRSRPGRWLPEPGVGRVADGVSARVDGPVGRRLTMLGNAVVPQVAEVVGRRLLVIAASMEAAQ